LIVIVIKEPSKPIPKHFMVSYPRNAHFTGREELLSELRHKLVETNPKQFNHRVAIHGLGGVGKTQIAIEYVYRNVSKYNATFWITATDQAALLSGYEYIAKMTGCVPTVNETPDLIAKGVISWLRAQESWLLVMDNLDDVSVVEGYLPEMVKGGHTLITTRNPDYLQFPAEGIEIPVLGKDEAIELLRLRSGMQSSEFTPEQTLQASDIVNELGYLALAIEQASAFIRVSLKGISDFLPIYKTSRKGLLERTAPGIRYPASLYATVLLSFEKVQQMKYGQHAMKLLQLLAFLNPDGILIEFLKEGGAGLSDDLLEIINDQFIFHEALNSLQQLSLVSRSKNMESVIVHRLIQAVTKEELSETTHATYQSEVLALCEAIIPEESHELYPKFRRLQNQIVEPIFEAFSVRWTPESGVLFDRIGQYLMEDGKFKDSQRFLELNLDRRVSLLGEEDLDTIRSLLHLAGAYWHQGRWPEAADLEEKVLEARRRTLGDEHPTTLTSMNNLAATYQSQDRLQEAADLEEKTLEARRRTLGDEHPATLTSMNNLAATYQSQGRLQEAVDLGKTTLEAQRRTLGDEHHETLTSMSNLAYFYSKLGLIDDAITLLQKALDGSQRILGSEHQYTTSFKETLDSWLGLPII
jgi:tetratricopeptide (TPR) repeat protein